MKKILTLVVALAVAGVVSAQNLCSLTGYPAAKKATEPVVGAIATLTYEWNKSVKYTTRVTPDGFQFTVPEGGYLLTIDAEGYEQYRMEVEIDQPRIDLGSMRMVTIAEAEAKAAKKKAKRERNRW